METNNKRIAELNDALRCDLKGGQMVVTQGIQALPELLQRTVLEAVRQFNTFTTDNDPYGEHDFGTLKVEGYQINWKVDYYDPNLEYQSENPADPNVTKRVITIMLSDEY